MTRICLVGDEDTVLPADLLAYATVRDALGPYTVEEPFANTIALETVSLGAAISLLNDLDWYLRRHVAEALVLEPSVSETEWLSRELATAVRNDRLDPAASGEYLKIYGVLDPAAANGDDDDGAEPATTEGGDQGAVGPASGPSEGQPALIEPMYTRRVDGDPPSYDLREVADILVVRITESEFSASG